MNLETLNKQFELPGKLQLTVSDSGIPVVEINTPVSSAAISIQGAQLVSWTPVDEEPVIWLSPSAILGPNKAIRGGIPICWPWFGPHESDGRLPSHGYARTALWDVVEIVELEDEQVRVSFRLDKRSVPTEIMTFDCEVELSISVGSILTLDLRTTNSNSNPITISEALHSYFNVGDVRNVEVSGLDGCSYLDKVDAGRIKEQLGAVLFSQETDRVYIDTVSECIISDPVLQRKIHINKQGSLSTVVWNPWSEKAAQMADMGENDYLHMLCVETANVANNSLTLNPGESHEMSVSYSVSRVA
ncbi:MAG: D-hexose-6-phosphate mutarotase [Gammaproteobacteria bacterium]